MGSKVSWILQRVRLQLLALFVHFLLLHVLLLELYELLPTVTQNFEEMSDSDNNNTSSFSGFSQTITLTEMIQQLVYLRDIQKVPGNTKVYKVEFNGLEPITTITYQPVANSSRRMVVVID